MMLTRRHLLISSGAACLKAEPIRPLSFWIFGLLHPRELRLTSCQGSRVHCFAGTDRFLLEPGESHLLSATAGSFHAAGPAGDAVSFVLEVPGVLRRRFYGALAIRNANGILAASLTAPVESAVGAILGAELPVSQAPLESLMAQAIVARSFLLGTPYPRHPQAFFCDTTHCQFLRSPVLPGSTVARAVSETAHLVLANANVPFAASYSAACGGRTRSGPRDGFVYTSVDCSVCRRQGYTRQGHGWGLCQRGAMELARQGATMHQILAHYFPRASLRYL